jgi:hypothetical protein
VLLSSAAAVGVGLVVFLSRLLRGSG